MKKTFLQALLLCACLPLMVHAQDAKKKSKAGCDCRFSSINQVGLLEGDNGSSFNLQTINGISYKTWFTGVGIGLDYYRFRTIPLFLDVRKDLTKKVNRPFVYGDIGVHLPWVRGNAGEWWRGDPEYNNGLYYDAGIGYSLDIGKKRSLLFSGGFSLKKMRETRNYEVVCVTFPCPEQSEHYDFTLKRVSIKAGLRL